MSNSGLLERHEAPGEGPVKGSEDDWRPGASLNEGVVYPGAEKSERGS